MVLQRFVALVAICSLAGCVEEVDRSGSPAWTKPDATHATFQRDSDECRRVAMVAPIKYAGPASVAAERRSRYNDCMVEHGYTLEKNVPGDSSKDVVDCKFPSVEQVQRTTVRDCYNRFGKIL